MTYITTESQTAYLFHSFIQPLKCIIPPALLSLSQDFHSSWIFWFPDGSQGLSSWLKAQKTNLRGFLCPISSLCKVFHQLFLWSWRSKIFSPLQSKALVTVEKYFWSLKKLQVILSLKKMSMLYIHIHFFSVDGWTLRDLSVIYEHWKLCNNHFHIYIFPSLSAAFPEEQIRKEISVSSL